MNQPEFPFKIVAAYNLIASDEIALADSILEMVLCEHDYRSSTL